MSNNIAPTAEIALIAAEIALTVEDTTVVEATATTEVIDPTEFSNNVEVVSDAELIAAAKNLNASAQSYLRKSVEEFWKLGETLTRLQERPSIKGRWREVLKEIGLNPTSANHAQRLYSATTLEKLVIYRNKTAALRALGILAEATSTKKETPDRSSKATAKAAPGGPALANIPSEQGTAASSADFTGNIVDSNSGKAEVGTKVAEAKESNVEKKEAEGRRPEPAPAAAEVILDPLTKITRIAANLEYMAADEFDLTAEIAAQVERAKKALDLLLGKGTFCAAA